ncbi:MAG: hypothetical protein HY046_14420 [Acidobacteria bacterium]|nr:hypothetical protein [Acidobacteriota bacterium]
MIVVADASPLNYLIQIGHVGLLERLYQRVYVPGAVLDELRHAHAPISVTEWLSALPPWIECRTVEAKPDLFLASLDPGEREAIQFAEGQ